MTHWVSYQFRRLCGVFGHRGGRVSFEPVLTWHCWMCGEHVTFDLPEDA